MPEDSTPPFPSSPGAEASRLCRFKPKHGLSLADIKAVEAAVRARDSSHDEEPFVRG